MHHERRFQSLCPNSYGGCYIYLLPVNLYGPADNFKPESSHVIPALIRKVHEAQVAGDKQILVWGDGSPSREFIYVDDAARGIAIATTSYDGTDPVNLGTNYEITITALPLAMRYSLISKSYSVK